MTSVRLFAVAMLALTASGCALRGGGSHLARLQSQVGLLDERITQLERLGVNSTASTQGAGALPADPWPASAGAGSTQWKSSSATGSASTKSAIKVSSNKPSTIEIQSALKTAGFYQGNVDGKMGPLTRQAVEEFQRINGLAADGVVGKQTWSKLKQYAELSSSDSTTVLK